MKSLLVLSALATIAIAAPSLLGEHFEDFSTTQETLPEPFKRDKKSLPEETRVSSIPESGSIVGVPSIHSPDHGSLTASARTLGLKKKPIIVKKKIGYHVYRDSDEERADSRESCPKQVKVKLCNAETKSNDLSRSSTKEMIDGDMKNSIKMAKEAVENLQRDLKNMENNPAIKRAPWKHGDPESDAEIHEDIEVARQALEHIHRNFGNMESMSLHATISNDADSEQDVEMTIAETDEEKMAQWKQALENIHKYDKIARNIEDSFKTPSHELHPSPQESHNNHNEHSDESKTHKQDDKENQLRIPDNHELKDKHIEINLEKTLNTEKHEHLIEKDAENKDHIVDDMKTSPSTLIEMTLPHESTEKQSSNHEIIQEDLKTTSRHPIEVSSTINDTEKKTENEISENSKAFDIESPVLKSMSMKGAEENTHTIDTEQKEKLKTSENIEDEHMMTSQNTPNLKESEVKSESEKATPKTWSDSNLKLEKDAQVTPEDTNDLAKLSEQAHANHVNKKIEVEEPELRLNDELHKPVDIVPSLDPHGNTNIDSKIKEKEAQPSLENVASGTTSEFHQEKNMHLKSAEHSELNHLRLMPATNDDLLLSKSADQTAHQSQHMHFIDHYPSQHEINKAMKSADNIHSQLKGPLNMRWSQDKNAHPDKLAAMKAAEEFKNEFMREPSRNMQFVDHQHHPMSPSKHFDMSNGMHPTHMHSHPSRLHDGMIHGKSPMDSAMHPSMHMNMRDAVATFDQGNTFRQWKPSQELSRTAYGSSLGYGGGNAIGGAVGVFPEANVGGCGIPLLLSCNPSVVSGRLSKGHHASSSYGAPAYRTEEDFNFHNKRDTTKLKETTGTKLKQTPLSKTTTEDKKQ